MTAVTLALVATLVALALAGIAGAACLWGFAHRRNARRWQACSARQRRAAHALVAERDLARRLLDGSAAGALVAERDAALGQLDTCVAWLMHGLEPIVGEGR